MTESLETIAEKNAARKETIVDTIGNVSYSVVIGTALDWSAGLDFAGIIASRTSATVMNSVTGGPYGKWRNAVYRFTGTNNESTEGRKYLTELLAFNTFQPYFYAIGVAIGSVIDNGSIDGLEVHQGIENIVMMSPLVAPTLGAYMNWLRKRTGLYSAAERAAKY